MTVIKFDPRAQTAQLGITEPESIKCVDVYDQCIAAMERVTELESALKAKDEQLKLWEDANGQLEARLKELAEECLPYVFACCPENPFEYTTGAEIVLHKLKLLVNK